MCDYCKEALGGKLIDYNEDWAIETLVSEANLYQWCCCGRHTVISIIYCPMCGRKLEE